MGALSFSGTVMQWIENKGYLASFLIQDGLGMTLPRVWTGFHRDKEVTGKYNVQEGLEVLGREGMTGPYIIGVAPFMLWAAGKFCRSTNTNTRLIKRLGESLKDMVKSPEFDKSIKNNAKKFKEEFLRINIDRIYKDTVPGDKNADVTVKNILAEFKNFDTNNKKAREASLTKIQTMINDKMAEHSADLYNVNKLYVGKGETKQLFGTGEVFNAIRDYANDAIINNSKHSSIDDQAAENIKNNFATKRLGINIANIVVTLAGLAYIPKLYVRGDVAPGVHTLEHTKQKQTDKKETENPSFKGKNLNSNGLCSKIGKYITKYIPEKFQQLMEYDGYNFTKTTFACLATFGLLAPRGKKAWDRAVVDENGKRDLTELHEIFLRDTISSLSVVFAVPCLTKMLVKSYEDKCGFILTNRATDGKNMFQKIGAILNPYSSLEVLSVADLDAIYGNIDSKAKLLNFSNFVNKKGGDLQKILSHSDNASEIFNEKTFTLDSIKHLSKEEKNKKILNLFETSEFSKETISKIMKGSGDIKHNKIAKVARGLNSLPGFISTVAISPILLGVLIPMLTYYNTRKTHEKMLAAKNAQTSKA